MLTATYVFDSTIRTLIVSDSTHAPEPPEPPSTAIIRYFLYHVPVQDGNAILLGTSAIGETSVRFRVRQDDEYNLYLSKKEFVVPLTEEEIDYVEVDRSQVLRFLDDTDSVAATTALYVSHAGSPRPLGHAFRSHLMAYGRQYEARQCFYEGNYLLAHQLLNP